jgi:hypothetical protein
MSDLSSNNGGGRRGEGNDPLKHICESVLSQALSLLAALFHFTEKLSQFWLTKFHSTTMTFSFNIQTTCQSLFRTLGTLMYGSS